MRIVGNTDWSSVTSSPEEALFRGAKLDALSQSLGIPDFRPKGVFRGSQAMFEAMDAERAQKIREWVNERARPA